jgi:hypothetical protein
VDWKIPVSAPQPLLVIIFLAGSFLKMVKRTNLPVNDRQLLKDFLLERVENGQLRRGCIITGAVLVSVSTGTVSRLWRQWNVAHANALNGEWNDSGKKANGRPMKKYRIEEFVLAVRKIFAMGALFGFYKVQFTQTHVDGCEQNG